MTSERHRFEGRSSGPRMNAIVQRMIARFWEREQFFEDLLTAGEYPPFTEPLSPKQQYDKLNAWRLAGDPRYWSSTPAQQAFDALSLQFGSPAPLSPMPAQTSPRIM